MHHRALILTCFCILTSACLGPAPRSGSTLPPPDGSQQTPAQPADPTAGTDVAALLLLAQQSPPGPAGRYRLQAATQLFEDGDLFRARAVLKYIDEQALAPELSARFYMLQTEIAVLMANGSEALRWLDQAPAGAFDRLPRDGHLRLSQLRATALGLTGDHLAAAVERILNTAALTPPEKQGNNHQAIWNSLMQLSGEELAERARTTPMPLLRGWLELAALNRNFQHDIDQQLVSLNDWLLRWPNHPAALDLPGDLQMLSRLADSRPGVVYLLLPLSGPYAGSVGMPVRDGFLASYYDAMQRGREVPEVHILDTGKVQDFVAAYREAVAGGAGFVIGPFEKEGVAQLASLPELSVPVLALNYLPDVSEPPRGLYQFGLSAEDEARAAAARAWQDGYRFAVGLVPGSGWGERVLGAFREHWTSFGGTLSGAEFFDQDSDYKAVVARLLDIDESRRRAARIEQLIGTKVEFVPQRRSDADFVFLAALPTPARLIKPSLNYHNARNLPIYATSHIYSGRPAPRLDRDLEGVRFCDVPWNLDAPADVQLTIRETWQSTATAFGRLYALGVDAFQVYPRLFQLETFDQSRFFGQTGALRLNRQRQVERELPWAVMRDGLPAPYPTGQAGADERPAETSESAL